MKNRAWLLVALVAAGALSCGSDGTCRDGTIFLDLALEGRAAESDSLVLSVEVEGSAATGELQEGVEPAGTLRLGIDVRLPTRRASGRLPATGARPRALRLRRHP